MLDCLIIGGGIHGTALSYVLSKRLPPERLRVLDPYEEPLARWDAMTENVGMTFLRSPHVHHLHPDPFALATFARTRDGQPDAHFIPVFSRPSLALFHNFSKQLITRHRLRDLRVTGRARGLTRLENGWRVETEHGALDARRVILAIGATEQPLWPDWAETLRAAGAPINHIFDPDFRRSQLPAWSKLVLIGGGLSAAQTALALAAQQPGSVTLLMRHPLRIFSFDSDPCWVVPICLKDFHTEADFDRRRAIIRQARHSGSVPAEIAEEIRAAAARGHLDIQIGEAQSAEQQPQGYLCLRTATGTLKADRILLATGFDPARPGGAWLDQAITDYDLPVAACGYPVIAPALRWSDGLYVSGPLAELEIGPAARNIIGARLAGERLRAIF